MLVSLRNAADSSVIAYSKAVMVQRDGDLVDAATGSSTLTFAGAAAGNYHVSVMHRNHLGIVTTTPVGLSESSEMIDFTLPDTPVSGDFGNDPGRLEVGGIALMWAGDANQSQDVIAHGVGNDINNVLGNVLLAPGNQTQINANYILDGYRTTDLNMDGITLFAGSGNDINIMLGNVLLHPNNSIFAANFIVLGGMLEMAP